MREVKKRGKARGVGAGKKSRVRLITHGSKFPVNHFYNTQAILLEEQAIQLRPTFHLRLTFMSSA